MAFFRPTLFLHVQNLFPSLWPIDNSMVNEAWRRNSVVCWSNIEIKKLVKCELVHTRSVEWGSALMAPAVVSLSAVKRPKKPS